MQIEIRPLKTLEEFQRCVDLQKEIWGFDDPYDAVPLPLLVVSERNDGIILGAFDSGLMIGFVYSLPGTHKGVRLQWSHMLAVTEPYRNSDVGYRLKMEQYRMSQQMGYECIEWTFDPLESKNAYFNMRKLGCVAAEYEINIYGETSSPLHSGSPTDRLVAQWPIPALQKRAPEWSELPGPEGMIAVTRPLGSNLYSIEEVRLSLHGDWLWLEIPAEMQRLKSEFPQTALPWRLKTREAFLHYFELGYAVYSFLRWENQRSFYVLKKLPL